MPLFEVAMDIAKHTVLLDAEDEHEARDKAELEVLEAGFLVDGCEVTELEEDALEEEEDDLVDVLTDKGYEFDVD